MKRKDGFYNILFSVLGQVLTLVLGFIVPKLFIENLGSESNGLMQTINQVFAYFTLIEAGIGTATVQALYKPLATDDKNEINSILAATNNYYRKVSIVYSFCLMAFAIIFSIFINSSLDKTMIFWVIIFTGLNSVLNFSVQGKYKLLLDASGKNYVVTITTTIITILNYGSKIVLLMLGFNLLNIQIGYFIISLLQIVIIVWYIKKHYSWINLNVKPDYQAISKKNSVLVHQFSTLIFNNTDVLILSTISGLTVSSIYAMYKLVANIINTLYSNVSSGLTFILGQTYSTNKELYKKRIDVFDVAFQTFGFAVAAVVYIFYLPFMKIYTAGFDQNYIYQWLPLLFIIIELLIAVRMAWNITITVAGHFKQTQWRSLLETIINLSTSIVLVFKFGIYGVLMGTVIALLYRSNDMIWYANVKILDRKPWNTYKVSFINLGLMILVVYLSSFIPYNLNNYFHLILSGALTTLVVFPLFYLVVLALCPKERKAILQFVKDRLHHLKTKTKQDA